MIHFHSSTWYILDNPLVLRLQMIWIGQSTIPSILTQVTIELFLSIRVISTRTKYKGNQVYNGLECEI